MNTGAIRAGRAFVEIFADWSKLQKGLASAEHRIAKFANAANKAGAAMMRMGAVMAAPFALSVKIFADFADKMSAVRAITNANNDDFERLQETAKKLGATTSFTASQVADAMKFLGMAGFNTQQILAGIPAVLDLARAGAIDLGMAADIASDVGSAFGLAAEDIKHIADVMAVTASSANTNIEMMGETLKYAAPLAKAAGQSLEDTATAIGIMGNSGIKASMAGTDLALIFKLMAGNAREAMESIGVFAVNSDGSIRSVLDVMRDLGAATREMTQEARLEFFAKNFDRAAKSAIIMADAGDSMTALRDKIGDADGAANRMALTMDDNLGGSFRQMMSALEGLAIEIGTVLAPDMIKLANYIRDNAGAFADWIKVNMSAVLSVAKLAAKLIVVGAAFRTVGAAAQAFGVALKVLMVAGPGIAIAAIATGLAYMSGAFDDATQKATAFAVAQERETRKTKDAISEHFTMFKRLEELAAIKDRTNSQQEEATKIVNTLTRAYGGLGLSINKTTGEIEGMAGAYGRLSDAARKSLLDQLRMEVASKESEAQAKRQEAFALGEGGVGARAKAAMSYFGLAEDSGVTANRLNNEADEALASVRALRQQMADIVAGGKLPLSNQDAAGVLGGMLGGSLINVPTAVDDPKVEVLVDNTERVNRTNEDLRRQEERLRIESNADLSDDERRDALRELGQRFELADLIPGADRTTLKRIHDMQDAIDARDKTQTLPGPTSVGGYSGSIVARQFGQGSPQVKAIEKLGDKFADVQRKEGRKIVRAIEKNAPQVK